MCISIAKVLGPCHPSRPHRAAGSPLPQVPSPVGNRCPQASLATQGLRPEALRCHKRPGPLCQHQKPTCMPGGTTHPLCVSFETSKQRARLLFCLRGEKYPSAVAIGHPKITSPIKRTAKIAKVSTPKIGGARTEIAHSNSRGSGQYK